MTSNLTIAPGNPASYRGARASVRHLSVREYAGKALSVGQVFVMRGMANDDRLVRLGYVELLKAGSETYSCRVCGGIFESMRTRDAHGNRAHLVRDDRPAPREVQASDVDRVDETSLLGAEPDNDPAEAADTPPLYLDQTAASRGVKPEPTAITL